MAQSKPLSHEEIVNVIPLLKDILIKQSPLFAPDLNKRLQESCDINHLNYRVSASRVRQMINYLRTNTILPVIGDKRGYRLAKSNADIVAQAQSLSDRAHSIQAAANGMMKFTI